MHAIDELVSGGKAYVMQLSPHAMKLIKKRTGLSLMGLGKAFQDQGNDPDFELIGTVVWATTQDHHPELTEDQAAGLFPAGGLEEIVELVGKVLSAAFPKSSAAAAVANDAENPPKAAAKS
jgi:hypothetical protein